MKKKEKIVEIEINEEEQKEIIETLIAMGQHNKINPLKFVIAMISLISTICETEGVDLNHLLDLYFDDDESSTVLH